MAETLWTGRDKTRARILVVEDEEALARLLKSHLERAGYEVRTEGKGKAASRQAAQG